VLQRQGGEQRKAHHHAERHQGERRKIPAAGARLPQDRQQRPRQRAGDGGPREGEEQGVEARHGEAGGGQGPAEDQHPQEPVDPPFGRLVHAQASRRSCFRATGMASPDTVHYSPAEL
jgi:hypothetical protein